MKKRWEARRGVCQPFKAAAQRGGMVGGLMGRPTPPRCSPRAEEGGSAAPPPAPTPGGAVNAAAGG